MISSCLECEVSSNDQESPRRPQFDRRPNKPSNGRAGMGLLSLGMPVPSSANSCQLIKKNPKNSCLWS